MLSDPDVWRKRLSRGNSCLLDGMERNNSSSHERCTLCVDHVWVCVDLKISHFPSTVTLSRKTSGPIRVNSCFSNTQPARLLSQTKTTRAKWNELNSVFTCTNVSKHVLSRSGPAVHLQQTGVTSTAK